MSPEFFSTVAGLGLFFFFLFQETYLACLIYLKCTFAHLPTGLSSINPKEKEFNSLTQTAFYSVSMIRQNLWRLFHEFTKECINQMAKSTLNGYLFTFFVCWSFVCKRVYLI